MRAWGRSVPRVNCERGRRSRDTRLATAHRRATAETTKVDRIAHSVDIEASGPTAPERVARVLVVDDDVAVLRTVLRVLSDGREVIAVEDGQAALALIDSGERFDLILCDLMMPVLSGADVYAALLTRAPDQAERFAVMTGGAITTKTRAFLEESGVPRISKPFIPAELRQAVSKLVGR